MELQCIAMLINPAAMELTLHMLDVFPQNNSYDYGLYAIANLTSIANGKDPTKMRYGKRKLIENLKIALLSGEIEL